MPVEVRPAVREDVPALIRLRLANAERHVELAPGLHRIPDTEAVRRYFEDSLSAGSNVLVLVAESDGFGPRGTLLRKELGQRSAT